MYLTNNLVNAQDMRKFGGMHGAGGSIDVSPANKAPIQVIIQTRMSPEEELQYKMRKIEETKRLNAMLAEQRRLKQESDAIKKDLMTVRALQNRKEQATNGLPTFQYQLGVSYITGVDGETNKSLGRYWLIRSATQGNEDAEKYLKELK